MTNTKEKRDSKNILIGTLLAAVIIMSVGYAALAQRLTINGTATISSEWNVAITDIAEGTKSATAYSKTDPTSTSTTATFDAVLTAPGDSITYDVTVTNSGSLDAVLDSIVVTPQADGSPAITYTVTGVTAKTTELAKDGGTNVVHVTATFDPAYNTIPTVTSKTVTVTLNYVQK